MIENNVYTCEICNSSYLNKEMALKCEESGRPEIYDKYLNKWIITPLNIIFTIDKLESSETFSRIEYRLFRVENNQILTSDNQLVGHKCKFKGRSFEDYSTLIGLSYDYIIEVDSSETENLNNELVEQEKTRNTIENEKFSERQHYIAETLLKEIVQKYNINLKSIDNLECVSEIQK